MIYAKKVNGKQRAWLINYEKDTTFQPMHQEELDSGEMTFAEVAKLNIDWFESWSSEVMGLITTDIP